MKRNFDQRLCHRHEFMGDFVSNERKSRRIKLHEPVSYKRTPGGMEFKGEVDNMSSKGICFTSKFPYLPGTNLYMKTEGDMSEKMDLTKVMWSKPVGKISHKHPKYKIGAKIMGH